MLPSIPTIYAVLQALPIPERSAVLHRTSNEELRQLLIEGIQQFKREDLLRALLGLLRNPVASHTPPDPHVPQVSGPNQPQRYNPSPANASFHQHRPETHAVNRPYSGQALMNAQHKGQTHGIKRPHMHVTSTASSPTTGAEKIYKLHGWPRAEETYELHGLPHLEERHMKQIWMQNGAHIQPGSGSPQFHLAPAPTACATSSAIPMYRGLANPPLHMANAYLVPRQQGLVPQSVRVDSNAPPHHTRPIEAHELQGSKCSPYGDRSQEPRTGGSAAPHEDGSDSSIAQERPKNEQAIKKTEVVSQTDTPKIKPTPLAVKKDDRHNIPCKRQCRNGKRIAAKKGVPNDTLQEDQKTQCGTGVGDKGCLASRKVDLEEVEEIDLIDPDKVDETDGVAANRHQSPSESSGLSDVTSNTRSIIDELHEFINISSLDSASE